MRKALLQKGFRKKWSNQSECLSNPLSFYATQIINPFLNSRILTINDKGFVSNAIKVSKSLKLSIGLAFLILAKSEIYIFFNDCFFAVYQYKFWVKGFLDSMNLF